MLKVQLIKKKQTRNLHAFRRVLNLQIITASGADNKHYHPR